MNKTIVGGSLLLTSTIIYGLYGIFSRQVNAFGSFSQGFIRYAIMLLVIFILLLVGKFKWKKIERKDIKWFLVWILPASFQPILTFIAFNHISIGVAYFLLYSTMILGGILSGKIFFSERLNLKKLISLLLVIAGLFFIYNSDLSLVTSIYVIFALVSGLIVGFWNTLSKKVSHKYSELQMILMDGVSTFGISLVGFILLKEKLPDFSDSSSWIWIFVFAVSGLCASLLLIKGFKYVEAQVGSFILPMEILFAAIFGYVFFRELLSVNVYFGGLLILVAAILPSLKMSKEELP